MAQQPSFPLIVGTSPSFSKNEHLARELRCSFPEAVLNVTGERFSGERLAQFVGDAEGLIVGLEPVDRALLDRCTRIKIVAKYGVGLDNVDLDLCAQRGIAIGWTGGVNRLSVAEMALGFMLTLCRNLYTSSLRLKEGSWDKVGGFELTGKTVGIVGVGHVGQELVRLLAPFRCKILVHDIRDDLQPFYDQHGLEHVPMDTLLATSDVVTIHTPLTPLTRHLANRRTLAMMKPSSFLINTARGPIVKGEDLMWALQNKVIAGAAIDVYEEEPPTHREFLALPNLICTPHIGGNSAEAVLAMGRSAIEHVRKFFGRPELAR